METLLREVIGCGRPAAWARVEDAPGKREDFYAICAERTRE